LELLQNPSQVLPEMQLTVQLLQLSHAVVQVAPGSHCTLQLVTSPQRMRHSAPAGQRTSRPVASPPSILQTAPGAQVAVQLVTSLQLISHRPAVQLKLQLAAVQSDWQFTPSQTGSDLQAPARITPAPRSRRCAIQ
jgi:hypothetical protein